MSTEDALTDPRPAQPSARTPAGTSAGPGPGWRTPSGSAAAEERWATGPSNRSGPGSGPTPGPSWFTPSAGTASKRAWRSASPRAPNGPGEHRSARGAAEKLVAAGSCTRPPPGGEFACPPQLTALAVQRPDMRMKARLVVWRPTRRPRGVGSGNSAPPATTRRARLTSRPISWGHSLIGRLHLTAAATVPRPTTLLWVTARRGLVWHGPGRASGCRARQLDAVMPGDLGGHPASRCVGACSADGLCGLEDEGGGLVRAGDHRDV
jgi:hypothetical protein